MKKQSCIICGKPLTDGIIVNGKGICKSCEERLINLEPGNDFYEYYKESIRKNMIQTRGAEYNCKNYHL